jgi:hypothetical protein
VVGEDTSLYHQMMVFFAKSLVLRLRNFLVFLVGDSLLNEQLLLIDFPYVLVLVFFHVVLSENFHRRAYYEPIKIYITMKKEETKEN